MIEHVSDTALWVAAYRALETERPDALFRDPLAARLAGERGLEMAEKIKGAQYSRWAVVIRTCIIDSYIREFISEGGDLVLNLGAGLDTRPYRMELPSSLRWIEVDFPKMIEFKEERLRGEAPKCQLERIKLDLSNDAERTRLLSEIASRSSKILVLTEGVTPYLTPEQVGALADDLRSRSSFRFWILEYFAPQLIPYFLRRNKRELKSAPFRFLPMDWAGFFKSHGWKEREARYVPIESEKLGRPGPHPWWAKVLMLFSFLQKREAREKFQKNVGYVLLEPSPK